MKKKLIKGGLLFIILIVICITGYQWYFNSKNSKTINTKEETLILKGDKSFEEGAEILAEKSIIASKKAFILYAKHYNLQNTFKAGNYYIKPQSDVKTLLSKLQNGKSDFAIVTIPEGYTLYKIASLLEKDNLVKKEDLLNTKLKEFDTNGLIAQKPDVTYDLEGYLFPDTYYIPYSSNKNQIIDLMYGEFSTIFSDQYRKRAKELNLSVNDIITIASLIEKEAANDSERSRIAGVIYNRLKRGMPLQIDAAVIYANTSGERTLNPITKAELKKDSKYNTYIYKELPPGPIASPGKASIEAALYPENNNYLYYVKGPNGSVFAETYSEHLQNVKKYLK